MKSKRQCRMIFYTIMALEGFIAMVRAAATMGVYDLGLQAANGGTTGTATIVCKDILGSVVALLAVILWYGKRRAAVLLK